jgi:hypothetical protein
MAPADFHRADAGNSASKAHEFLKIQAKNPRALRSELELLVLVSMTSVFFEVFFKDPSTSGVWRLWCLIEGAQ